MEPNFPYIKRLMTELNKHIRAYFEKEKFDLWHEVADEYNDVLRPLEEMLGILTQPRHIRESQINGFEPSQPPIIELGTDAKLEHLANRLFIYLDPFFEAEAISLRDEFWAECAGHGSRLMRTIAPLTAEADQREQQFILVSLTREVKLATQIALKESNWFERFG